MSVLKTIKSALNNVQQVGSSITTRGKKSGKQKVNTDIDGVDLDAGADLLNRFQQEWVEIHEGSEDNARAAEIVHQDLHLQFKHVERQNEASNHLMALTSSLPFLLNDIDRLVETIDGMDDQFRRIEADLTRLLDVIEQGEMEKNKQQHHQKLASYRREQQANLEKVKAGLEQEHTRKVANYEVQLQERFRVKQEAFEEAFAREMQHYKEYGSTQMKPLLLSSPPDIELADINIDQDNSDLNDFLGSEEIAPNCIVSDVVTVEDDDDDDPGSYVNIGLVSTVMLDPELEPGDLAPVQSPAIDISEEATDSSDGSCEVNPDDDSYFNISLVRTVKVEDKTEELATSSASASREVDVTGSKDDEAVKQSRDALISSREGHGTHRGTVDVGEEEVEVTVKSSKGKKVHSTDAKVKGMGGRRGKEVGTESELATKEKRKKDKKGETKGLELGQIKETDRKKTKEKEKTYKEIERGQSPKKGKVTRKGEVRELQESQERIRDRTESVRSVDRSQEMTKETEEALLDHSQGPRQSSEVKDIRGQPQGEVSDEYVQIAET